MVSSLHKQEVGPSCTAVAYTEGETANARKPKRDEEGWNSRQITGCDKRDFQSDCTSHAERGADRPNPESSRPAVHSSHFVNWRP